ncbi:uncharacterized protein [Leptinotarsa decemlineata]|uniref:uncharacterized protein n=1 Tax=Leptinotarsa decemlineata TaxID=7539 RepID=UPI003D3054A4
MEGYTQQLTDAVASIMQEEGAVVRPVSPDLFEEGGSVEAAVEEKAATSRGVRRASSPCLFEESVAKRVKRQSAKVSVIDKYRSACNRTNPYASSWSTARNSLRPPTPPAPPTPAVESVAAVETPRVPSPGEILTQFAPLTVSPLTLLALTPAPQVPEPAEGIAPPVPVPVSEPIGGVSECLKPFFRNCEKAEDASRSGEAALVDISRNEARLVSRRSELLKELAEVNREIALLEESSKVATSSIERYRTITDIIYKIDFLE